MKRLLFTTAVLIVGVMSVDAQSKAQLTKFTDEVTTAFSLEDLASLDAKSLRRGFVRLKIDNSIGEPEVEKYRFSSFKSMSRWFEKPGNNMQAKIDWPLVKCSKGECSFFRDGGILHNHFYLTGISYGYRNKRLYVRRIEILAG